MRRFVFWFAFWLAACFAAPRAESPLIAAARAGDPAEVKRLATAANVNEPGGGNGWTPLMHAIHKNQLGAVDALLGAGADPNRAAPGGETPLMMAAGYGQTGTVLLLMKRGADARMTDHNAETALDYALSGVNDIDDFTLFRCQDATVRALLAGGAPAHARSSSVRAAKFKRCESAALVR